MKAYQPNINILVLKKNSPCKSLVKGIFIQKIESDNHKADPFTKD